VNEREQYWNERYRSGANLGESPSPLLLRAVRDVPPGSALELACGAGRNAIYLASLGWAVTAVDLSPVAVETLLSRANSMHLSVDARRADLEAGEFSIIPDSWDLICAFYYLQRDLFEPIRNGIRPGGLFVGSIHMPDDTPGLRPMNPAYLLNEGELRAAFRGWEILHYQEGKATDSDHDRRSAEIIAMKCLAASR
jgi:tellurite methyltransferase